jgi:hypothetical protein
VVMLNKYISQHINYSRWLFLEQTAGIFFRIFNFTSYKGNIIPSSLRNKEFIMSSTQLLKGQFLQVL